MAQVDRLLGLASGSAIKVPVKVATTANITLSGEQTIDGVSCVTGDRVLVKNQTDATEAGIYIVDSGAWSRAKDWNGVYDVRKGTLVFVHSGSTNQGWWYVSTADPITVDTTEVTIAQASTALAVISAFAQTLIDDTDADAVIETLADGATAETSLAVGDLFLISDVSANDGRKVTLQNIANFLAALTQTLTNKTLTSPVINSATGIGQSIIRRKSADESVTTSTTLQDDDHLLFAIAASEEWVAQCSISIPNTCSLSTTGLAVTATVPSGATGIITAKIVGDAIDDAQCVKGSFGSALTFAAANFISAGGMLDIMLSVVNSTNAGSVTIQWAQATSSGTALTFSRGSFMVAHRVA